MYQIEKNVPLANSSRKVGRPAKYPLRKMKLGDSFLVPCTKKGRMTVSASVHIGAKRYSMNIVTRYINAEKGLRVWRVK